MKKIFSTLIFIICAAICFAQGPPPGRYTPVSTTGYNWTLPGAFTKGLHVPAISGFPLLQPGQWNGSGAIMMDSITGKIYRYWNGSWTPLADSTTAGIDSINSITVPSISNLRSVAYQSVAAKKKNSSDRLTVTTQGYYTINDGGQSTYIYVDTSTMADNGGSVIKPTSVSGAGRWKLVYNGSWNIRQFGAKGDGVTDDRPAVLALLAALPKTTVTGVQYAGTMEVPAGNYYLSDSIRINFNLNIIGTGTGTMSKLTSVFVTAGYKPGFIFRTEEGFGAGQQKIANIAVTGGTNPMYYMSTANGIYSDGRIDIDNCYVYNMAGSGIVIDSRPFNAFPDFFRISNTQCFFNRGYGIATYGYDANQGTLLNNFCNTNGMSGVHEESALGNKYFNQVSDYAGFRQAGGWNYGWTKTNGHLYVCMNINTNIQPGVTSGWENYWSESPVAFFDTTVVSTWRSDSTYYDASPIWAQTTASNEFYACYCEGGQGCINIGLNSMWLGGTVGTLTTASQFFKPNQSRLMATEGWLTNYPGSGIKVPDANSPTTIFSGISYSTGITTQSTFGSDVSLKAWSDTTAKFSAQGNTTAYVGLQFPMQSKSMYKAGEDTTSLTTTPILGQQGVYFIDENNLNVWHRITSGTTAPSAYWHGVGHVVIDASADTSKFGWKTITRGANGGTSAVMRTGNSNGNVVFDSALYKPAFYKSDGKLYKASSWGEFSRYNTLQSVTNNGNTSSNQITITGNSGSAGTGLNFQYSSGTGAATILNNNGAYLTLRSPYGIIFNGHDRFGYGKYSFWSVQSSSSSSVDSTYLLSIVDTANGNLNKIRIGSGLSLTSGILSASGGGGGTPGGNNETIQLNRNSTFTGTDSLKWTAGGLGIKGIATIYNSTKHGELSIDGSYVFRIGHDFSSSDNITQHRLSYYSSGGYGTQGIKLDDTGNGFTTVLTQVGGSGNLYWVDGSGNPGTINQLAWRNPNLSTSTITAGTSGDWYLNAGRLSVGTSVQTAMLGVLSTSEQLRLQYDASNYIKTTVASTGSTTIDLVGTTPVLTLADSLHLSGIARASYDTTNNQILVWNPGTKSVQYSNWYNAGASSVTASSTTTFTNKRITWRVNSVSSSSTPTPDADSYDKYFLTALAANATFGAPTGTPTTGQTLEIRIRDNGTARTIAWNSIYRGSPAIALPTTTDGASTDIYLTFEWNELDSKWDLIGLTSFAAMP